jgi:hypothetical protein
MNYLFKMMGASRRFDLGVFYQHKGRSQAGGRETPVLLHRQRTPLLLSDAVGTLPNRNKPTRAASGQQA